MDKDRHNRKLLIVGSTPQSAGVGGVTVHVDRLRQYLDRKGFPYELFDYKIAPLRGIIDKVRHSDVIHLHICNPYFMFCLAMLCSLIHKKFILTLHGKYVKTEQKPWPLIRYAIKKATVPIVLNQISYNTCSVINKNTTLIPAFIPPQTKESLEQDVIDIVNKIRSQGKQVAVTYGFDDQKDVNGREVYGVSFLIPIFNDNKEYSLIVSNPTGCYKQRFEREYPNVYFIDHPLSLYELLKISDLFVRNTSKDGDSLSVKESLYLGKRVICTDVIERPHGVQLFSYSDQKSFMDCLNAKNVLNGITVESGEEKLLKLYNSLV